MVGGSAVWRASRTSFDTVAALQDALEVPEPVAWALARRGLADAATAREFLAADGPLAPAEALAGITEAAGRIAQAVRRRERIVVHGDYDCDGVVSTAVLLGALRARGADVVPFLPSRFAEGFGVASATVERLADEGCRLLVCVDCGTSAVESLERAVELGMDVVVLDHHLAGGRRPPAIIANPALGRPAPDLPAAAGVVFMLTRALAHHDPAGTLAPAPETALDLVALATVADAVPLVGDNRRMVVRGIEAIRAGARPGIAALCAAGGTEPRTVTARTLGFTLAPCINAAGRLTHPERALELLMAPDLESAEPIAQELWRLNLDRREVERTIVDEAIAMVEAEPAEIREAGAVVAAGDGWHEGVVGIVASRLAERFERPAIVISRDGDRCKGSGRSVPGVDLHAMVGAAAATLTRWGGHAGAIGLELPAARVADFRTDLFRAAEGSRAAIERARVRTVDAVAGCADLTLATAEALEALAPFGRGNPPVRLVVPAVRIESPQRVGQGRHLQVRLRAGGVHARGIGFQMGPRAPGLDLDARHDAVIALEVERWQGVVGPRVGIRALQAVGDGAWSDWAAPCDIDSPERAGLGQEMVAAPDGPIAGADRAAAEPRGVRDHRGAGAAVAVTTALAGADRGVAVVVADVARRIGALGGVLEPSRLGVEVAAVLDARMARDAVRARLEAVAGVSAFLVMDHATLGWAGVPDGVHVVVLDPPSCAGEAAAVVRAAGDRWLHLVWGEEDVAAALRAAEDAHDVRASAAAAWRALRDGAMRAWGDELDRAVLGDAPGCAIRVPHVAARGLAALAEVGLVEVDAAGVRALPDAGRRDLGEAPTARTHARRLEEVRAFLEGAAHLDLSRGVDPLATRGIVHT